MKKIVMLSVLTSLALGSIAFADSDGVGKGGKRHGGMFAKLDTNADGKITREEAAVGAKAFFDRLDADHDGKVSDAELTARRADKLGKLEGKLSDKLWSKDANGDGKLQRSEVSRMPEAWFGKIDANKDNTLTKAELAQAGETLKARHAEHAKARFTKLDQNKDGVVTVAEFQTEAKTLFDKFDADKNGSVEPSEMPKRGHGRGHFGFTGKRAGHCDPDNGATQGVTAPKAANVAGSAG